MIDILRSEWIKLRSVRSTLVLLLLAAVVVVLVAVLAANSLKDDTSTTCEPLPAGVTTTTTAPTAIPEDGFGFDEVDCGTGFEAVEAPVEVNLTSVTGGVSFAVLLFGVLGVQVIGQEYRFNTIRPTFTAVPDRRKVLIAKLIVVALATAVVSVVMLAFCWLVGTLMVDQFAIDSVDQRVMWAIPLFAALWAGAGVGVGAIVRQPIAGILVLLGESLVLETLLAGLVERSIPWLPFSNGFQMTLRVGETGGDGPQLRPVLEGGIYFAIVCAALFVIGMVLADRRDA